MARTTHLVGGIGLIGLVQAKDGLAGARKRISAASRYARQFGVSTECGMSRARPARTVRSL